MPLDLMKISDKKLEIQKIKSHLIVGKKCKIFLKQDYIIKGFIYSIDKFFNFLIHSSYIFKFNKKNIFSNYFFLRFVRGENIIYIMIFD
jgi:small nuclear ribonucleoprotein (snRNP)-like protein